MPRIFKQIVTLGVKRHTLLCCRKLNRKKTCNREFFLRNKVFFSKPFASHTSPDLLMRKLGMYIETVLEKDGDNLEPWMIDLEEFERINKELFQA